MFVIFLSYLLISKDNFVTSENKTSFPFLFWGIDKNVYIIVFFLPPCIACIIATFLPPSWEPEINDCQLQKVYKTMKLSSSGSSLNAQVLVNSWLSVLREDPEILVLYLMGWNLFIYLFLTSFQTGSSSVFSCWWMKFSPGKREMRDWQVRLES